MRKKHLSAQIILLKDHWSGGFDSQSESWVLSSYRSPQGSNLQNIIGTHSSLNFSLTQGTARFLQDLIYCLLTFESIKLQLLCHCSFTASDFNDTFKSKLHPNYLQRLILKASLHLVFHTTKQRRNMVQNAKKMNSWYQDWEWPWRGGVQLSNLVIMDVILSVYTECAISSLKSNYCRVPIGYITEFMINNTLDWG